MSSELLTSHSESRLKQYKLFESLSVKVNSAELNQSCERFVSELNQDPILLTKVIADLNSPEQALRQGSCNMLGRLLDQPKQLNLTSTQRLDVINYLVLWLTNASSSKEAALILWSLKRDALLSKDEMKRHVVTILYACQRAASDIKSESASRPSYAVAAAILQLISRLYVEQKELMQENTKIWFSLTLSYCCHGVSRLLRTCSQEVIEQSYNHLLQRAENTRSIVSDVSENVIANITNVLHKQYDEPCKLFAIKLWGLLITIMGEEMENAPTTDLYLSAMTKAFSKNYPSRQTAAFKAWKLLVQNFSTDYLLQLGVRLRLCIPLTKSNRVEEKGCLQARFDCWWTLIRKLGPDVMEYFTEICHPLLEFCLPQERSSIKPGLKGASIMKPLQANLLQEECLAVTLQFLGEYDTVVLPDVKLGFDQRRMSVTKTIVRYCGKDLLRAVKESFSYVQTMEDKQREEMLPALLRAHTTLVKGIIHSSGSINNDVVRTVVRLEFSLILNSSLTGNLLLDLLSPALDFGNSILSSTAYTPTDGNSYIRTPASFVLEKMWTCCTHLEEEDTERFCDCICKLLERGSPPCAEGFIQEALQRIPKEKATPLILRPLRTLAAMINRSLLGVKDIDILKEYLCACEEMIDKCPTDACAQLMVALGEGLGLMFGQWPDADTPLVLRFWGKVADKLQNEALAAGEEVASKLLSAMLSILHNSTTYVRERAVSAWKGRVAECTLSCSGFSLMVTEIEKEIGAVAAPITGLPPTPGSRKSHKISKSPSTKKKLVIRSPSRSPLMSVNKKQLVLQDSPVLPGRKRLGSEEPESFGLLNGLITPEKRRKLTELTPDKSLRVAPITAVGGMTPTKRSGCKQKRLSKSSAKSTSRQDSMEAALVTPPIQCSQSIDNSPEQSQMISQCDTSSQKICEETESSNKMELSMKTPTKKQLTKLHTAIAPTPGLPVTSPVNIPPTKDLSVSPDTSTLKFSSPDSTGSVSLPLCSVKITRTRSIEKHLKKTQSKPSRTKPKKIKASEKSQTDSQCSFSSQSSMELSQNSKSRKKKIITVEPIEFDCDPVLERKTAFKARVAMVTDSSVPIVSCRKIKAVRSRKSKVKRLADVLCLSQESQELPESQEAPSVDDFDSQMTLSSIDVGDERKRHSDALRSQQERLFEGIASHDSFFDPEETPSLHADAILDCSPVPVSDSLEFSSGEVSKPASDRIISSSDSRDITPLPPRLVVESKLSSDDTVTGSCESRVTEDSETDDDVLLISTKLSSNTVLSKSDVACDDILISTEESETVEVVPKACSMDTGHSQTVSRSQHIEMSSDDADITSHDGCVGLQDMESDLTSEMHSQTTDVDPVDEPVISESPEQNGKELACTAIERVSKEFVSDIPSVEDVLLAEPAAEDTEIGPVTKEMIDDDITMSQFDEEMEVPAPEVRNTKLSNMDQTLHVEEQEDLIVSGDCATSLENDTDMSAEVTTKDGSSSLVTKVPAQDADMLTPVRDMPTSPTDLPTLITDTATPARDTPTPAKEAPNSAKDMHTTATDTPTSITDIPTPARDTPTPTLKMSKGDSSSPSRAQLLLRASRSSQILAKAMSTKSANSPPVIGMNHVNTLPATPRSSKLNIEALELDCTPIYSPTTGSILKRKHCNSPSGSSSKKVKFRLPEAPSSEKSGSIRKLQKRTKSTKDSDILAMYSSSSGSGSPQQNVNGDTGQSQSSSEAQPMTAEDTDCITESAPVESQSTQSTPDDSPIASEYTESTVPIDAVVTHLNRPNWHANLKQCLISQGITTVGSLARLTEADIDPLPIAKPKLSTTLKAFKKSGASKNPPKSAVTSSASKLSKIQMETIMQLVTDSQLTDSQLGSQIRSIFAKGNEVAQPPN